jgi:hypothetical protein
MNTAIMITALTSSLPELAGRECGYVHYAHRCCDGEAGTRDGRRQPDGDQQVADSRSPEAKSSPHRAPLAMAGYCWRVQWLINPQFAPC